jgi:hypothetical protein
MTSVEEEIRRYSNQYSARLSSHPNEQILTLMELPGKQAFVKTRAKRSARQIFIVIVVLVILVFKV